MGDLIQRGSPRLIYGYGVTGQSLAVYCRAQAMPMWLLDRRSPSAFNMDWQAHGFAGATLGDELQALCQDQSQLEQFLNDFVELLISPGVPISDPVVIAALKLQMPIRNDIGVFLDVLRSRDDLNQPSHTVKVIAITGSNGKSTVTDCTAALGVALGHSVRAIGNIGVPVLSVLDTVQPGDIVVIELSSYQLELIHELGADVALLLNMSPDHLDRHGDLQTYWRAKQNVYVKAKAVVVNKDDPLSTPLEPHKNAGSLKTYVRFGLGAPDRDDFGVMHRAGESWLAKGIQPLMPVSRLAMSGPHHFSNFLAVLGIADVLGWPLAQVCEFIASYHGLAYRCQPFLQNDILWLNDSKGTNVGASLVALHSGEKRLNSGRLWWIAGGLAKGGDFSSIGDYVATLNRKHLFAGAQLYGQDRQQIAHALSIKSKATVVVQETLLDCVNSIHREAQAGDVVVFSPACASMDQFANFEARGQAFDQYVNTP